MERLSPELIKNRIAKSDVVFSRGESIFLLGNYSLRSEDLEQGQYTYAIDGTYGDYTVTLSVYGTEVKARCTCPFPHAGCKHVVAACLDVADRQSRPKGIVADSAAAPDYLTPEQIRALAIEGRKERARKEKMTLLRGETLKGAHTVRTAEGREYTVTIYRPEDSTGHCTCADYATNHLETCKHLLFAYRELGRSEDFAEQSAREVFPFVHFTWNSRLQAPACYYERIDDPELRATVQGMFSDKGIYTRSSIAQLVRLYHSEEGNESLRFDEYLVERLDDILEKREIAKLERGFAPDYSFLRATLYPYQQEGIRFAVFRKAAIIADEMGLGKTLQAIAVAVLKKRIFGFSKVLVVSPASLKEQWRREIAKFTDESAVIVQGGRKQRQLIYEADQSLFKITNYEAVLRDLLAIRRWKPELVILDEAQRIKNFENKTHEALMSLPRSHSLVITGTPLENRLEDVYSVVQFSDRTLLTPLWAFAANHLNMSSDGRNKVMGYRNLEAVHDKLKSIVIRRRKEEVFDSLPEQVENNHYLDLSAEQAEIHYGYLLTVLMLLRKKFLTPMDIKRIQKALLAMRMVCDSTYLIDRKTNISPKLVELASILQDVVLANRRKLIIFTEWTTMSYLIGKVLSELGISFVEFSGRVPSEKRPLLIDRFRADPECMVFLSTDAGGLGLNLQNADCVLNFELPWNPARLNQRIGRVNRLGQKSRTVNVLNLICKSSIEEKVLAAINLKQELFDAVLEGGADEIDFSAEKKNKLVNQLRAMFGEEPLDAPSSAPPAPELDERTPHYLNPEVLKEREAEVDLSAEEPGETAAEEADEAPAQASGQAEAERIESVLNQGLAFLSSLSQMATGKALIAEEGKKAIEVDRATGEVVLRFRLPGF